LSAPTFYLMQLLSFRQILSINTGEDKARRGFFIGYLPLSSRVMLPIPVLCGHCIKMKNCYSKPIKTSFVRNEHLETGFFFYLRAVSRFHEFCSRQHLNPMGRRSITSHSWGFAIEICSRKAQGNFIDFRKQHSTWRLSIPIKWASIGLKIYGFSLQGLKLPIDNLWAYTLPPLWIRPSIEMVFAKFKS